MKFINFPRITNVRMWITSLIADNAFILTRKHILAIKMRSNTVKSLNECAHVQYQNLIIELYIRSFKLTISIYFPPRIESMVSYNFPKWMCFSRFIFSHKNFVLFHITFSFYWFQRHNRFMEIHIKPNIQWS